MVKAQLKLGNSAYEYYPIHHLTGVSRLPFSLKILLENLLRHEDGVSVKKSDIDNLLRWDPQHVPSQEISFMPSRVILQDFTGVPAICDLAAMRDAMFELGGDPQKINPLLPAELVIDHSVQVDVYGTPGALKENAELEFARNQERYAFLRWGQKAFANFKVVPPDTGIVHQVNLEFLARVVFGLDQKLVYPDSVVGTDSHTTMINALGVLGWGVGGIEAEAAMLGQPIPMLIPQVLGVKLTGKLPEGVTSTDLVLTITEALRKKNVVGKFVEFFGHGLDHLTLADRATLSNMAPEYGSTVAFFPIDEQTLKYLRLTGRPSPQIALVENYAKTQGLFRSDNTPEPLFTDVLAVDLSSIQACLAGPKRPQDRVALSDMKTQFAKDLPVIKAGKESTPVKIQIPQAGEFTLKDGAVVIASITSCTNTSNPSVLIGAGLLAKKAVLKGLQIQPWVKTSLAPGSKVVTEYLKNSGLLSELEKLKFHVVGYGCTTCIGNSGPLPPVITTAIETGHLVCASVLSGNRNFEGRINPHVRANYLASPPLVVAYALAGSMDWDPIHEPIGHSPAGEAVFLKDIWPSNEEIQEVVTTFVNGESFRNGYLDVFEGDTNWQSIPTSEGQRFEWDSASTYIQKPPFFAGMTKTPKPLQDIVKARVLAVLGDSITTDHISPAGNISPKGPAGIFLNDNHVSPQEFNSYGARRGNHHVMIRGTFANIRLRNQLVQGIEGGQTVKFPENQSMSIYDASVAYQQESTPLIILAGKEYGSGSSRDWAAKGTAMLGVRAVIATSYERIHRSNLIGMGVLPLQFLDDQDQGSLGLSGFEVLSIMGIATMKPGAKLTVEVVGENKFSFEVLARIDTSVELEYYNHGGILPFVLRQMLS